MNADEFISVPLDIINIDPLIEKVSIDCGGTLIKVVHAKTDEVSQVCTLEKRTYQYESLMAMLEHVRSCLGDNPECKINVTGVSAIPHLATIQELTCRSVKLKDEFTSAVDCFMKMVKCCSRPKIVEEKDPDTLKQIRVNLEGGCHSAKVWRSVSKVQFDNDDMTEEEVCRISDSKLDEEIPYLNSDPNLFPCLIIMLGSGFTAIKIDSEGRFKYVSFNSRGGRTLLALSALIADVKDFDELISLASSGNNYKLHKLATGYNKSSPGPDKSAEHGYDKGMTFGDLAIFKLGLAVNTKRDDWSRGDLVRSVIGLLMDDAATWIEGNAVIEQTKRVFLLGGVIKHNIIKNELIKQLYSQRWLRAKAHIEYHVLKHGDIFPALGAMMD